MTGQLVLALAPHTSAHRRRPHRRRHRTSADPPRRRQSQQHVLKPLGLPTFGKPAQYNTTHANWRILIMIICIREINKTTFD